MKLPSWLSNPYLGLLGLIVSVAGLFFGVYAYHASQQYSELKYAISPDKSVLIDSNKASDFEITFSGQKIDSDVTSTTITIWNDGKKSIRPENILEPIILKVGEGISILEAKIIKSSRNTINLTLDNSKNREGIVMPSWKIFEHKDGGVIQIIYAGSHDTPIVMSGVIEGKKEISGFMTKMKLPFNISWNVFRIVYSLPIILLIIMKLRRYLSFKEVRSNLKYEWIMWLNLILMILVIIFMPIIFDRVTIPVDF